MTELKESSLITAAQGWKKHLLLLIISLLFYLIRCNCIYLSFSATVLCHKAKNLMKRGSADWM